MESQTALEIYSKVRRIDLFEEILHKNEGESSRGNQMGPLWHAIWGLQLPNNIKVFMWRATHNVVPTVGNLEHRKIIQSAWCPQCGLQRESLLHALWECDVIQALWDESVVFKCNVGSLIQISQCYCGRFSNITGGRGLWNSW